ncbi:glucose dehydrogenase [FAD, quinone]-like [Achroia grisella]|uniref:glucose dehydrogenase [FAD, quinone]-like n=1 Tax=Achroia grisella TaxID=688607 RepID=UPI0027D2C838|nr:glucose dehydrogenase [FAD, quinone]-like [Achroia grisella]
MLRSPEACACPIQEVGPSMAGSCPNQYLLFMTILEAFVNSRCDLADPCQRITSREDLDDSYDFIVAGGGTAGAVVAGRLSENPQWKVLLIEAGGDEPTASSVPAWVTAYWGREETDWMYYTEPQEKACLEDEGKCYWPRGKMLGGCSVINGMMYQRGHSADYDAWAVNGAAGWSWFDVLPYFLKSEDNKEIGRGISGQYHNTGGPLPVQKFRYAPQFAHDVVSAAIEIGYLPTSDLNGETITGFTIAQTMSDGSRYSTARTFLRPGAKRDNLHVLLNAHVSRVIVDPVLKKVQSVEYIKNGETKTVRVNKEAILSAGTLNTPQILLLSGIGPKDTLNKFNIPTIKELPGVGQNLQNHVGLEMKFTLNKLAEVPELNWATAMDYMLKREGPLSGTGLSQLTGIVNSKYASSGGRDPDLQFFFGGFYAGCGSGDIIDPESDLSDKREVSISGINLHPRSRGYISIRSVDPLQPPVMQPNYFLDEHDLDVLVEAGRIAYRLANSTILREKYGMTPSEEHGTVCQGGGVNPTDEFFKCLAKHHTAPENHQVGTCKMGPESDPMAVVDMELKVHGIEGLRVVDASIMPTVISANTAAPTIMIGERGAEFIRIRHQRSKNKPGDVANRFGDDTDTNASGNYASNEGDNGNRWTFGDYASNEAKDDKLTNNHDFHAWDHRWKPWEKNFHTNRQWDQKNQYFQPNNEWYKHQVPSQTQNYENSR